MYGLLVYEVVYVTSRVDTVKVRGAAPVDTPRHWRPWSLGPQGRQPCRQVPRHRSGWWRECFPSILDLSPLGRPDVIFLQEAWNSGTGRQPPIPVAEERCTVSGDSTPTARPLAWDGEVRGRQMDLYANGVVDAEVQIVWHLRETDDEFVSILFGKEQVTLEFFDVESLERLRDVADEGARRLRAVVEANARAALVEDSAANHATAVDQPVELVGGGVR